MFLKCFPCRRDPILLANCSDSFDGLQGIKFKGEMRQNMIPRLAKSSNLWIFHKDFRWVVPNLFSRSVCPYFLHQKHGKKKIQNRKKSIIFKKSPFCFRVKLQTLPTLKTTDIAEKNSAETSLSWGIVWAAEMQKRTWPSWWRCLCRCTNFEKPQ